MPSFRLVLFDVLVDEEFMSPFEFAAQFANVDSARVIFRGKFAGKFAEDIRQGKYDVAEGVVVKGVSKGELWMARIKTNAYMAKLKKAFADRWEDFWE